MKMKKHYYLLVALFIISAAAHSQNLILNGSFETNTATSNALGLTANWASTVANSFEIDGGEMDLITLNSCGNASDGNWYVTCSNQSSLWPYMAFSFKLSTTLTMGAQYTLKFDKRYCGPNTSPIDIGVSNDSTLTGTFVHTFSAPTVNTWATETYIFQAPLAAKYLTVNVGVTGSTGTVGLDKFSLTTVGVGINENVSDEMTVSPNPSNGVFTVSLPTAITKSQVEIVNVLGELVFKSTINNNKSTIDLSKQAPGIYFYKIINAGEMMKQGKICIE